MSLPSAVKATRGFLSLLAIISPITRCSPIWLVRTTTKRRVSTVDLVLTRLFVVVLTNHMGENLVIGDMMASRLRNPLVAFTAEGKDIAVAELCLHVAGNGVDIIADQPHRTGGEHRDRLGVEDVVDLLNRCRQLLLPAKNDV